MITFYRKNATSKSKAIASRLTAKQTTVRHSLVVIYNSNSFQQRARQDISYLVICSSSYIVPTTIDSARQVSYYATESQFNTQPN